jgi:hypothetical protein
VSTVLSNQHKNIIFGPNRKPKQAGWPKKLKHEACARRPKRAWHIFMTLALPLDSRVPHVFVTLSIPLDSTSSSRLSLASFPRSSSRTSPPHCSCTHRRPTSTASGCSSSSSSRASHPSRTSSSWVHAVRVDERSAVHAEERSDNGELGPHRPRGGEERRPCGGED